MTANLIEQLKGIEAQADGLLTEAGRRAREVRESVDKELAALKTQLQARFEQDVASFVTELDAQTAAERADIDARARQIAARLESPGQDAVSAAADLVLKRLRGE